MNNKLDHDENMISVKLQVTGSCSQEFQAKGKGVLVFKVVSLEIITIT